MVKSVLAGGAIAAAFGIATSALLIAQPAAHRGLAVKSNAPAQLSVAEQRKGVEVKAAMIRLLNRKVSSPNGKLFVKVVPAARVDKGYFSEILVSGRPVQVKKLRITELTVHARNLRINVNLLLRNNDLHTIFSETKLRAVVTEDDLTYLLAQGRSTKPMGLKVKYIGGNQMRVTGNFQWGWFNGPVIGIGKLRLAPGHKVYLDIASLKLNGAEVPDWLKSKFSDKVNPVIDYNDLPFHPQFKSLTFKGTTAILIA